MVSLGLNELIKQHIISLQGDDKNVNTYLQLFITIQLVKHIDISWVIVNSVIGNHYPSQNGNILYDNAVSKNSRTNSSGKIYKIWIFNTWGPFY